MHTFILLFGAYISLLFDLVRYRPGLKLRNKINNIIIVLGTLCFVVNMSSEKGTLRIFYATRAGRL